MSKGAKRAKSSTNPTSEKWEVALLNAVFEEEKWKPNITLLVGNKVDDYKNIGVLATTISSGIRKRFTLVSKDILYNQVRELGNPKLKKTKDVPANYEICEVCKPYLDSGEEIPVSLLAKLIKFHLMAVKMADLQQQELEKKAALDREKAAKDMGSNKDKSQGKKGGKKTPEAPAAREGSKLLKRGEQNKDTKYIDDEPDDGAHRYIIMIGFNDPHLLPYLAEIGVNVDCILRVSSQEYSHFTPPPPDPNAPEKDEKTLAAEEAARQGRKKFALEIHTFWHEILPLLRNNPDSSRLHDIARLDYEVENLLLPVTFDDPVQRTQFGEAMFEDVACMIYDLLDARRLYHTYIKNLKLQSVPFYGSVSLEKVTGTDIPVLGAPLTPAAPVRPSESSPVEAARSGSAVVGPSDMRYYNDLMNCLPLESVSVPLVLHCMLEQVVASEENRDPPSEQSLPRRPDGLNSELANQLSNITLRLAFTEQERKLVSEALSVTVPKPENKKSPLMINTQDDVAVRTHYLKPVYGFSPEKAERAILRLHLLTRKLHQKKSVPDEMGERAARLHELIHFCEISGLSMHETDRAFKQFVFECIDIATTDPNGFIVTRDIEGLEHSPIPWDDPYSFFKGMISKERKDDGVGSDDDSGAKFAEQTELKQEKPGTHDNFETNRSSPARRSGSSDSRKGILRSRSNSTSPRRSHSGSCVQFQVPLGHYLHHEVASDQEEETAEKSLEESMEEITEVQKRVLDQWCFAEHFQPEVLLQVLKEAYYCLPFVDTYFHKRDQTLMVVFHNPHNKELRNHLDWHVELHSNVGFRNYLEYIAESIGPWLKVKEAEYQAQMLSTEVVNMNKEEERVEKKGKTGKSPNRAESKSPARTESQTSNTDLKAPINPYIRQNSIKGWKEEQERQKEEERLSAEEKDTKKKKASPKRSEKSPKEKMERSGSRSSVRGSKEQLQAEEKVDVFTEEPFWPFTGYDTKNLLLHVSGITTTLFPSDGGQICSERTEFVQGTTMVRASVVKDNHIFTVHLLNPYEQTEEELDLDIKTSRQQKPEGIEKADFEISEKTEKESKDSSDSETDKDRAEDKNKTQAFSQFGSIVACMSDGMIFSTGTTEQEKPKEPIPPEPSVCNLVQQPQIAASPKGKKDKEKEKEKEKEKSPKAPLSPEHTAVVEEDAVLEEKAPEKPPLQPFQELIITTPDGLHVQYFLESLAGVIPESENDRRLVVKQFYPFKICGVQDCNAARLKVVANEVSRIITGDGTVIKTMVDESVEVLYADGTVAVHTGSWLKPKTFDSAPQSRASLHSAAGDRETPTKKVGRNSAKVNPRGSEKTFEQVPIILGEQEEEKIVKPSVWKVTCPDGSRWTKSNGIKEELPPALICVATDPDTKQTMATRNDHVITVNYPDGTQIVEHSDGTRITEYYRDTLVPVSEEPEDTEQHNEEEKLMTQTLKFVKVECPGYATVEFNCATTENLTVFGSGTSINVFPDGYYILHHWCGGRIELDTEGTLVYYPRNRMEQLQPAMEQQYILRHNASIICETVDPSGNSFNISYTGDFGFTPAASIEDMPETNGSNVQLISEVKDVKPYTRYGKHAPRFFIINPDGSGTELLRYQDIAEYLTAAERNPATAVLKEPVPEYPGMVGITILKPMLGGLSERWLKQYHEESIVPKGLRCRDLITLPPREYKKPGPHLGKNAGRGLSVGSTVKVQTRVPILRCPNILEVRQLVQYKPVTPILRAKLKQSLSEYVEYVGQRKKKMNAMSLIDPRLEVEKMKAKDLLTKALVERLHQPLTEQEHVKEMYESGVRPPPPSPPRTPQPKRTEADWERDKRELVEEFRGLALLRDKKIPNYFESEMGKAFLLTQAKDMDEMMNELTEDPRRDGSEAVRVNSRQLPLPPSLESGSSATVSTLPRANLSQTSDRTDNATSKLPVSSDSAVSYQGWTPLDSGTQTPRGLRPGNPTPWHAGHSSSPAILRPLNPTPAHANKVLAERPVNPSPQKAGGGVQSSSDAGSRVKGEYPMIPEQPKEEDNGEDSTQTFGVSVTGDERQYPVPLPSSLLGGRPGAQTNMRFRYIEEPVRRQVRNTAAVGVTKDRAVVLRGMRGLNLLPEEVDFGVLREGSTYLFVVLLKNTGIDSCRFNVRQPPPSTGLRVFYKPGPVAAGMSAKLNLELYAIAFEAVGVEGSCSIRHDLEIVTETDIMHLPVRATVLTTYVYDEQISSAGKVGLAPGVVLISKSPPGNVGIIKPRKEVYCTS